MKALISRHPRNAKKVSVTGAGHLLERKNTDFVWELRRTGFCEGSYKKNCRLTRVSVMRASRVEHKETH